MRKKFKVCSHGCLYEECPICCDEIKETRIEKILEEGVGCEED